MLISLDYPHDDIEIGEMLVVVAVNAANVVKDIRENIRNLVGGQMSHYEGLVEDAIERALTQLEEKAEARGYDGVIGVKISHPHVVDGGVEVIVYGNGFRNKTMDDHQVDDHRVVDS
ncbi:YbjQ family protein [Chloroflexi bacterium TSY]|nr:YbjQ family protein [Chloroflexi bacterium TSY]